MSGESIHRLEANVGEVARELAELSADWPDLAARAGQLADRAASEEFRVVMVGQFKRGKSTLLNALVGRAVLPSGVLPVTAVPIEVAAGDERASVLFLDGRRAEVALDQLGRYTNESENPANCLGVDHAEVRLPAQLLRRGLVLIDLPGIGSPDEAASEVAARAYKRADGAVLVLSADAPLTLEEGLWAKELRGARLHQFVVVNKVDRLAPHEAEQIRHYVASSLGIASTEVFCLSARAALDSPEAPAAGDFATLLGAIRRFSDIELAAAKDAHLEHEVRQLASETRECATLERLAGEVELDSLEQLIGSFRRAAEHEHRRFNDERLVLGAEVKALTVEARARLLVTAEARCETRSNDLEHLLPVSGSLAAAARNAQGVVESIVREEFDDIWAAESARLDQRWRHLAERHRREAEERINAVRAIAGELLALQLDPLVVPPIEQAPGVNLYRFVSSMTLADELIDPLRRIVPLRLVRRHLIVQVQRSLERELDKHAGRAGAALAERLAQSWHGFEHRTETQFDAVLSGILAALTVAQQARAGSATDISARRSRLDEIGARAAALASPPGRPQASPLADHGALSCDVS